MVDDRTLIVAYQIERDERAREELVTRYENLARALARRYAHRGESLDDLVQVANLGLLQAIERYSIEREVAFSSFAVPTILGEIKRHFRDKTWSIRVPRDLQELSLKVEPMAERLSRKLGRSASDDELAAALSIDLRGLSEARGALDAYRANSLDTPIGEDEGLSYAERVGRLDPRYTQMEQHVFITGLLESLAPRERQIVELRFYRDLSQAEIAEQVGVSQMHVSRLLRGALADLAKAAKAADTSVETALDIER